MALLDLSLVTRALIRVIEAHVSASPAWVPRPTPTVVPLPPDRLAVDALGLYLYHVREEAHYKNTADPHGSAPPVRYQPLALSLYYQLSINGADTPQAMYEAQLLFGCALRALHDVPVLADGTVVNGVDIFDEVGLDGADNRIRVTLQPVPDTEAVSYWTAGSTAVRTAAYYQASVVLLEAEPAPVRAGRVRLYGVHTFLRGAPRLTASENRLVYGVPGVATPQEALLRPAEVPIGGQVAFLGSDLAGEETHLLLTGDRWREPRAADAGWGVAATPTRLLATVRETIDGEAVIPGFYTARARVVTTRTMPDGSVRRFERSSNGTPFAITPRIDAIGAPDALGVFVVTGYPFEHADLDPERVEVFLGADRATRGTAGALSPGEFDITSGTTIEARLPAGTPPGAQVPVRILVNGAESPPRWVESP